MTLRHTETVMFFPLIQYWFLTCQWLQLRYIMSLFPRFNTVGFIYINCSQSRVPKQWLMTGSTHAFHKSRAMPRNGPRPFVFLSFAQITNDYFLSISIFHHDTLTICNTWEIWTSYHNNEVCPWNVTSLTKHIIFIELSANNGNWLFLKPVSKLFCARFSQFREFWEIQGLSLGYW